MKRILGYWDSVAIIIAVVIGVGIFRVPAEVATYVTSPNLIIFAWLLGGVICLLGALCYGELSASFPETGGNYIYLRESYGRCVAFLFGWSELLVVRTGSLAAVSFICAEHLQSFLGIEKLSIKPTAAFVLLAISAINMLGLRYGKGVQDVSTIVKMSALVGILLFGAFSGKGEISHFHSPPVAVDITMASLFGLALIPVLWAYGGWHENTFVAGETKDPRRIIPLSLITGVLIVSSLYVAMNCLYIYVIPAPEMANAELIGSDVLYILYGARGRKILEALVIISSLGSINAIVMTGGRITYAMARDNAVFNYIGRIHARRGTPERAIFVNGAWSIVLVIVGSFNKLLFFTGVLVWLFFGLAVAGVFVLRRKFPHIPRPYKVWGYPVVPALFALVCAALVVNTMAVYTYQSAIGLGLLMTGVPVYLVSQKMRKKNFQADQV